MYGCREAVLMGGILPLGQYTSSSPESASFSLGSALARDK